VVLRVERARELDQTWLHHVGQVQIAYGAVGGLLHPGAVAVDPLAVAQRVLAGDGTDRAGRGAFGARGLVVGDGDAVADEVLEVAVDVVRRGNLTVVDGDQIVPRCDAAARLLERRTLPWVPGVAFDDVGYAVVGSTRRLVEVGAQEADFDPRCRLAHVATADVCVAGVELADHLPDEVVEVGSIPAEGDEAAVLRTHALPVDTVHAGVVEPVPLDPPRLVEDLQQLGIAVDLHRELGELDLRSGCVLAVPDLGRHRGSDLEVAALAHNQGVGFGAQVVVADALEQARALLLGEVVGVQGEARGSGVADVVVLEELELLPGEVEESACGGLEAVEVRGLETFDGDDASCDALEVDGDLGRRARLVVCGGVVVGLRRLLSEGRGRPVLENDDVGQGGVEEDVVLVDQSHDRLERPLRQEVQKATLRVEGRTPVVGLLAGQASGGSVGNRVEEDRLVQGAFELGVRDPPAVRRPHVVLDAPALPAVVVLALGDERDHPAGNVDHVEAHELVGEEQSGAVRRPHRTHLESAGAVGQLPPLGVALRIEQPQLLLAAAVGQEGDVEAVRRPDSALLPRCRAPGQVDHVPLVDRDAQDLAARPEQNTFTVAGEAERASVVANGDIAGSDRHTVTAEVHCDLFDTTRLEVIEVQGLGVLEDDLARAR